MNDWITTLDVTMMGWMFLSGTTVLFGNSGSGITVNSVTVSADAYLKRVAEHHHFRAERNPWIANVSGEQRAKQRTLSHGILM